MLFAVLFILGLACFAIAMFKREVDWLSMVLAVVGILLILIGIWNGALQYLFPTIHFG